MDVLVSALLGSLELRKLLPHPGVLSPKHERRVLRSIALSASERKGAADPWALITISCRHLVS